MSIHRPSRACDNVRTPVNRRRLGRLGQNDVIETRTSLDSIESLREQDRSFRGITDALGNEVMSVGVEGVVRFRVCVRESGARSQRVRGRRIGAWAFVERFAKNMRAFCLLWLVVTHHHVGSCRVVETSKISLWVTFDGMQHVAHQMSKLFLRPPAELIRSTVVVFRRGREVRGNLRFKSVEDNIVQ